MFNRAYYLSGSYALWKPALVIGLGAIGCNWVLSLLLHGKGAEYGY